MVGGRWEWDPTWRRGFFVWEESLLAELREVLERVPVATGDDLWI